MGTKDWSDLRRRVALERTDANAGRARRWFNQAVTASIVGASGSGFLLSAAADPTPGCDRCDTSTNTCGTVVGGTSSCRTNGLCFVGDLCSNKDDRTPKNTAANEDRAPIPKDVLRGIESTIQDLGPLYLLKLDPIRSDLGVTQEQKANIERVASEAGKRMSLLKKEHEARIKSDGPKAAQSFYEKALADWQESLDRDLVAILNPAQRKRLKQIVFQARGPAAVFEDPEVARQLNLHPDQQEEAARIWEEARLQANEVSKLRSALSMKYLMRKEPPKEPEGNRQNTGIWSEFKMSEKEYRELKSLDGEVRRIDEKASTAIMKLLTAKQKAKYRDFYGAPFNFRATLNGTDYVKKKPVK